MKTIYACLLTYTDQGVRNLGQSPQRARAWRQETEAAGLKVTSQLWFAGAYDGLVVIEGDNEEKVLGAVAKLVSQGNVRTQSMRAFDADGLSAILGS
ncbi:MAG: GYD domain-containing protein [Verrucomicrobiales bacterium]